MRERVLRYLAVTALGSFCALGLVANAAAATTLKAGTTILCTLDETVDSATLHAGADFKLRVNDPSQPALTGAEIVGHVSDVTQPSGSTRARVGFLLDYVRFANAKREPIRAYVLNKSVVATNTQSTGAASRFALPPMPTRTPGPIAWQMRIGGGQKPSVGPSAVGATGGYIYAQKSNETIVITPGAAVTIELANSLQIP